MHHSLPFRFPVILLTALVCFRGGVFCASGQAMASHIPAGYTGKPLSGKPQPIPGVIQAESYDLATGPALDMTVGFNGELRHSESRPMDDSIGLGQFGSDHVSTAGKPESLDQVYVGWTHTGEWMAYTVEVKETGTYIFGGKFSAGGKGTKLSATFTPELTTGPVEIPTTAGFQPKVEVYHVWETLDHLAEIQLPAGIYVMKVKIEKDDGLNLDYYTFTKKP